MQICLQSWARRLARRCVSRRGKVYPETTREELPNDDVIHLAFAREQILNCTLKLCTNNLGSTII